MLGIGCVDLSSLCGKAKCSNLDGIIRAKLCGESAQLGDLQKLIRNRLGRRAIINNCFQLFTSC